MPEVIDKLEALGVEALREIKTVSSLENLEKIRVHYLGKKGALSSVLRGLGQVDPSERPKIGALANELKTKIESSLEELRQKLEDQAVAERIKNERVDITLPARSLHQGHYHVITQTMKRVIEIFTTLGFETVLGPEAETDFLNFEAANIPPDHPSRDMQATFFLGPGVVLRTHTTAVQMRVMREQKPPVRILCPGAVYRSDHDATHSPMFHQIEGLWVDKGVRMSDLKGVLEYFAKELFGAGTKIRLRPSYFPFVEPGAEMDVSCFQCRKKKSDNCRICKGTGWLEILGAGMVHPRLFETAGYKAGDVTGFAFGMGIDRIAMLLFEIPDLRLIFGGDVRFLKQF